MKIVAAVLAVLALLMIAQNTGIVPLRFLVWKREMSLVLVLLFTTALGFAVGWLLGRIAGAGRKGGRP